jgi:hypothetical protein
MNLSSIILFINTRCSAISDEESNKESESEQDDSSVVLKTIFISTLLTIGCSCKDGGRHINFVNVNYIYNIIIKPI